MWHQKKHGGYVLRPMGWVGRISEAVLSLRVQQGSGSLKKQRVGQPRGLYSSGVGISTAKLTEAVVGV